MAAIAFDHVQKRYPGADRDALADLVLDVADGEFLVLVGPSGCGKTTALRCLAGLEDVSGGRIRIGERDVTHLAPKDRDIAMVFQSYALYPHLSVFENLAFSLRLRKAPRDEVDRKVREAAAALGLDPYLGRKPGALSGGQRQRVALGRAIVRDPAVFLMDEPLSNLDAKLRVQTRAEIARLHQRLSTTIVYVTHDQVEAMTMGDRIAVLRDGVLQQVGTPEELYGRPRNRFVAGFIGSPAMNQLTGQVVEEYGAVLLRLAHVDVALAGAAASLARGFGVGRTLTIGVRPEHLDARPDGIADPVRLPASVEVVEFLGNEHLVHARVGDEEVVAMVPVSRGVKVGDRLDLVAPAVEVHAFDPETEEAVRPPALAGQNA